MYMWTWQTHRHDSSICILCRIYVYCGLCIFNFSMRLLERFCHRELLGHDSFTCRHDPRYHADVTHIWKSNYLRQDLEETYVNVGRHAHTRIHTHTHTHTQTHANPLTLTHTHTHNLSPTHSPIHPPLPPTTYMIDTRDGGESTTRARTHTHTHTHTHMHTRTHTHLR